MSLFTFMEIICGQSKQGIACISEQKTYRPATYLATFMVMSR